MILFIKGDSGGPLITSINDRYYLSGVVSYGSDEDCNGKNFKFSNRIQKLL
jgi:secreted trypsin-like serine protease